MDTKLLQLLKPKFGNFKLKSGNFSPYYMNLRHLINHPNIIKDLVNMMFTKINTKINIITDKTYICGLPYAGIPYVLLRQAITPE